MGSKGSDYYLGIWLATTAAAVILTAVALLTGWQAGDAPTAVARPVFPPRVNEELLACGTCHSMAREVQALQSTGHGALVCQQCHVEFDVDWIRRELAERNVTMLGMTAGTAVHSLDLQVPNQRCVDCHAPQMEAIQRDLEPLPLETHAAPVGPAAVGLRPMAIRAEHDLHLTGRPQLQCKDCHQVHGPADGVPRDWQAVVQRRCQDCHDQQRVHIAVAGSTSCQACHPDPSGVAPADHRPAATFMGVHGQAASDQTCGACHLSAVAGPRGPLSQPDAFTPSRDTCQDCHRGQPMPHPAGFLNGHSQAYWAAASGTCESCHGEGSGARAPACAACHAGVTMPHPTGYLNGHGRAAQAAPAGTCEACHSSRNPVQPAPASARSGFCTDCHAGVPMPHATGFLAEHGQASLQSASGACATCHSAARTLIRPRPAHANDQFCTHCHAGLAMPHPANFQIGHGSAAWQAPATCSVCHSTGNVARPSAPHAATAYCANCHDAYRHPSGWVAAHGTRANQACAVCHSGMAATVPTQLPKLHLQGNDCTACHTGVAEWHPPMWFINHASVAETQGQAGCMRCHTDIQPSCTKCHSRR